MSIGQDAAVQLIVNISSQYPSIYKVSLLAFPIIGLSLLGYTLVLFAKQKLGYVNNQSLLTTASFTVAVFLESMLIALPFTIDTTAETFLSAGYGSLFPPEVINESDNVLSMIKLFAKYTLRVFGLIFGGYGLIEAVMSRHPDSKSSLYAGIVRLIAGCVLVRAQDFLNLFGGIGDVIFN